jgi:hypothetical protein
MILIPFVTQAVLQRRPRLQTPPGVRLRERWGSISNRSQQATTSKHMTMNDDKMMSMTESTVSPMNIATISAGFEKGDFLVREEQGNRVYFDFFEEVRIRKNFDCRRAQGDLGITPQFALFDSIEQRL